MKITTTVKRAEMANFIIARALESLERYPDKKSEFDITIRDVEYIKEFRSDIIKALTGERVKV